jgi:hypothetical protein
MNTTALPLANSPGMLWAGRIITVLVALFLLFDAGVKLVKVPSAVQATVQLGYPKTTVFPIGLMLLISLVCYLIPRTSILGAILLTGYLGGATATMVRVGNPWMLFPVFVGMLVWAGIYLRDGQVRALIPLHK